VYNRAFCVAGPVAWNSLPLHTRSAPTLSTLKTWSIRIFSRVPTSLSNCFAEYEQRTLHGALVVTLAMLLRLINCRLYCLLWLLSSKWPSPTFTTMKVSEIKMSQRSREDRTWTAVRPIPFRPSRPSSLVSISHKFVPWPRLTPQCKVYETWSTVQPNAMSTLDHVVISTAALQQAWRNICDIVKREHTPRSSLHDVTCSLRNCYERDRFLFARSRHPEGTCPSNLVPIV